MEYSLQKSYSHQCQDFTTTLYNLIMESLQEILIKEKNWGFIILFNVSVVVCIATETFNNCHHLLCPLKYHFSHYDLTYEVWVFVLRFPHHVVFQIPMTTFSPWTPTVQKTPPLSTPTCIRSRLSNLCSFIQSRFLIRVVLLSFKIGLMRKCSS